MEPVVRRQVQNILKNEDLKQREIQLVDLILSERQRSENAILSEKEAFRKVGNLETEINTLQKVHIRLSPRALVDLVEDMYESEYRELMNSYRRDISTLEKDQKDLPGKIAHLKDELENPQINPVKAAQKRRQLSSHTTRLEQIPGEIEELKKKLLNVGAENTRSNRIAKRKHLWNWIMDNKRDDRNVKAIWEYIEKWYAAKSESFRDETTLPAYVDHFCDIMGQIHEEASNNAAHVIERIPLKDGYEFKLLRVYGVDDLDEFTTILINAVGLTHLYGDTLDADGLLLPGLNSSDGGNECESCFDDGRKTLDYEKKGPYAFRLYTPPEQEPKCQAIDILFKDSVVSVGEIKFQNYYTAYVTVLMKLEDYRGWKTMIDHRQLMPYPHFEMDPDRILNSGLRRSTLE
ncbi:nicolin 1 [Sarracenia purpurea var. burkii]